MLEIKLFNVEDGFYLDTYKAFVVPRIDDDIVISGKFYKVKTVNHVVKNAYEGTTVDGVHNVLEQVEVEVEIWANM